jgi:glycosyltransferase involved in cell wall biosynthesis
MLPLGHTFETAMRKSTRVLIAIDWYRPAHKAGGPITSIENLVDLLGDEPYLEFYVVCGVFDYGEQQPLDVPQETWVKVGKAQVQYWHPKQLGLKQWMQIYQTLQPDIIHTQGLWSPKFSILPLLVAQRYKIAKIVVSPRGMLTPQALKQKGAMKAGVSFVLKALSAYKNVVFHSTNDQETDEIRLFLNQENSNSKVGVAGVSGDPVASGNAILQMPNVPRNLGAVVKKTKREKQPNELHWLFVGRISPEKNPLLLLEALQLIEIPTKGYFIGGCQSETYRQQFEEKIKSLPKQHEVEYMGEKSLEEITEFLGKADVSINTSISENFGHSMAEALSAGVPIIVGPNAPWQRLSEDKSGVVAEYSAQGFVDAMLAMAALDSAEHQGYQEGAKKRFSIQCELSATKAKYLNLYLLPNP